LDSINRKLKREFTHLDLLTPADRDAPLEIHLTHLSEEFENLARQFLRKSPGRIQRANLGAWTPPTRDGCPSSAAKDFHTYLVDLVAMEDQLV
jgi:hypothetical protein